MSATLVRSLLSGNERFAVTGASGWLGRTTLELLADALGPARFGEAVTGFASTTRAVTLGGGTVAHLRPLHELAQLDPAPTHLLHCAYVTRDRVAELGVPAYVNTNMRITASVVAAIRRFRLRGVFVTSSGAVYGPDGGMASDVDADPYGSLKHLEELAVRRAAGDAGARSVVARVFSLAGAYMTKPTLYALGDLVLQGLAGGPITVRARRPVERSYRAAADVVAVAVAALLEPDGGADMVFDTGGEVVEVGELAERVLRVLGLSHAAIYRSWDAGSPTDRYVGDGTELESIAARHGMPLQPLDGQIRETAAYLAQAGAWTGPEVTGQ